MKISTSLLVGVVTISAISAFSQMAFAYGHKPLLMRPKRSRGPSGVKYYGGPIIGNIKIQTVFWGPNVDATVKSDIGAFYQALVASTYIDQLTEYGTHIKAVDGQDGTQQSIEKGSYLGEVTITPHNTSKNLTQTDMEAELEYQVGAGAVARPDADVLYMIHFPSDIQIQISFGGSCETWLADHEIYHSAKYGPIAYAMMPCGNSADEFSNLTVYASHEIAESITDPQCPLANQPSARPAAWIASDGNEIGDLCTSSSGTLAASSAKTYNVQGLWSNTHKSCVGGSYHVE